MVEAAPSQNQGELNKNGGVPNVDLIKHDDLYNLRRRRQSDLGKDLSS